MPVKGFLTPVYAMRDDRDKSSKHSIRRRSPGSGRGQRRARKPDFLARKSSPQSLENFCLFHPLRFGPIWANPIGPGSLPPALFLAVEDSLQSMYEPSVYRNGLQIRGRCRLQLSARSDRGFSGEIHQRKGLRRCRIDQAL